MFGTPLSQDEPSPALTQGGVYHLHRDDYGLVDVSVAKDGLARQLARASDLCAEVVLDDIFGKGWSSAHARESHAVAAQLLAACLGQADWSVDETTVRDWVAVTETWHETAPGGAGEREDASADDGDGKGEGEGEQAEAVVYWNDRAPTRAKVLVSGVNVVVLQGPQPRGHAQLPGKIVRVQLPGSNSRHPGRVAAYGQANTFLVVLGLRAIRGAPRLRVDVAAMARLSKYESPVPCRIVDLSRSGARVLGVSAPIGTTVELSFAWPGQRHIQVVRAVVVRTTIDPNRPQLGLAFCLGA